MLNLRTLSAVALSAYLAACSIGGQGQSHGPLEVFFERGFDGHTVAIVASGNVVFEEILSTIESVGYAGYAEVCQRVHPCSFGIVVDDSLLQNVEIDTRKWHAVTVNLRDDRTLVIDRLDRDPIYD